MCETWNKTVKQYLDLLEEILTKGRSRSDRTGTGTIGLFGPQMTFDLSEGFPLVTTKRTHLRSIIIELLWMLSGSTNVHDLQRQNVSIWDEWAKPDGDLGPVYGKQWRSWEGKAIITDGYTVEPGKPVDQIAELIANLKRDPFSRRHVISAWNPADLGEMALAPCHCLFQFHVEEMTLLERLTLAKSVATEHDWISLALNKNNAELFGLLDAAAIPKLRLNCKLYQRSADVFLGVPFNIASYALLTSMLAQVCGFAPGIFTHTFGDVHIYKNHLDQVRLQLTREPKPLPTLRLNPEVTDLFAFKYEDIIIDGYESHPAISAPVAV